MNVSSQTQIHKIVGETLLETTLV